VNFVAGARRELDLNDPFEITLTMYGATGISLVGEDANGQPQERNWRPRPSGTTDLYVPAVTFPVDSEPRAISSVVANRFYNAFGFMRAPDVD
jgi:hypothetical protein